MAGLVWWPGGVRLHRSAAMHGLHRQPYAQVECFLQLPYLLGVQKTEALIARVNTPEELAQRYSYPLPEQEL